MIYYRIQTTSLFISTPETPIQNSRADSMEPIDGESSSYNEIEIATGLLDTSVKFHVVKDVLAFILYMHQQIPSILQDLEFEFDALQTEYKELELHRNENEVKVRDRRVNIAKMREVKYGIKRLRKLICTAGEMEAALKLLLIEVPNVQNVLLILGASSMRPQHVYELCFSHGGDLGCGVNDFAKSKVAEGMSRKAIRMLISKGAGSTSYGGQSKLFLVVKAPSSLTLPHHFLPKRDFKYSKKIVPMRLHLKCKLGYQQTSPQNHACQPPGPNNMDDSSNPYVWFQCRHVIKGISVSVASTEN